MTRSKRADELQIKPLDVNTAIHDKDTTKSTDPRVEAFLARLHAKAEAIDSEQRENHVTAKVPRRRPVVEQAANPDWYQPSVPTKSEPVASSAKRFAVSPGRKAKTG